MKFSLFRDLKNKLKKKKKMGFFFRKFHTFVFCFCIPILTCLSGIFLQIAKFKVKAKSITYQGIPIEVINGSDLEVSVI